MTKLPMVDIEFIKPCTIDGEEVSPGDIMVAKPSRAKKLIEEGIARLFQPGQSESIRELKRLLKRHPVKIDLRKGIRLIEPPDGAHAIWSEFQRISHLVFLDEQVGEWLAKHKGQMIYLYKQSNQAQKKHIAKE
ncbi:MAG: hypothetical protein LWW90_03205 [Candidatus Desulfofervidus auxilii]|nr:hypothetical protein [Candidatus Desulfofervidus auxilii]